MRRPCGVRLAAGFFGFVLVLIAPEVQAHGGDPSLIHGCVSKHGRLRIVGPSDTCKPHETALDWPKGAGGGSGLVLKDANGTVIGPYDAVLQTVFLSSPDGPVYVQVDSTGFQGVSSIAFYYTSTDCSGPGLMQAQGDLIRYPAGSLQGGLYYYPSSGTTMTVNSIDLRPSTAVSCSGVFIPPDICCFFVSYSSSFGSPPQPLDISGFVPPFHLEIAP